MKSSFKKIASTVLFFITAVILCVVGASFFRGGKSVAQAAAPAKTTVKIEYSLENSDHTAKSGTIAGPGDYIVFNLTITSDQTDESSRWNAVDFTVAVLDENGMFKDGVADKFTLDTSYKDDNNNKKNFKSNLFRKEYSDDDEDYVFVFDYYDNTRYQNSDYKKGFNISVAENKKPMKANEPISISYRLKVNDGANLGNLTFGIPSSSASSVQYKDSSNTYLHTADVGTLVSNSVQLKIGTVSSDATLKSLHVGETAATESVTVADSMNYTYTATAKTIKIKPTLNDSAAKGIKYSVGASSTPSSDITSGSEQTINLDSSGTTVVKFLVTAENDATKPYTLTIVSGYARLASLAVTVNRPSGVETVTDLGLKTTFNKDTKTYDVKVTSDCTDVQVTPTIEGGYGATGVDVATTGCTSDTTKVTSGSAKLTNITNGATAKFTITAADGTTKYDYTLTFDVVSVKVGISSLTMTEKTTGTTVNSDSSKTGSGIDFYFKLSEASGFKGTFNITLEETDSSKVTAKINSDTGLTQEYGAGSYNLIVTAEAGNSKTYIVKVVKDLKPGTINNLQYKMGSGSASAVITDGDCVESPDDVYTLTKKYNPADYPANPTFTLTGTPSAEAVVSADNINGGSGAWSKTLSLGKNEFSLTAKVTDVGETVYKFVINLVEDKNGITSLTIKNRTTTNPLPGFSFSQGTTSYGNIDVPFKDYDYIDISAITDGQYTAVFAEVNGGAAQTFTHTTGTKSHALNQVALQPGQSTPITIYAKADGNGTQGTSYTLTITRAAAATDALLQSLDVTVNGSPVSFKEGAFNPSSNTWNVEIDSDGSTSATLYIKAVAKSDKATVKIGSDAAKTQTADKTETWTLRAGQVDTQQYSIVVTPEDGPANTYTLKFTKKIPEPEFTDLQVSFVDENGYTPVLTSSEFNSTTNTYEVTKYISDVPVNSKIFIKGEKSNDSTVDKSSNLTANGSTWNGTLTFGTNNRFELTVKANGKTKKYTVIVKLIEDKYAINDVQLTVGSNPIETVDGTSFYFNSSQYEYTFKVPYKGYDNIDFKLTTDGFYTVVLDETHNKDFTSNLTIDTHELKMVLTAGKVNTIKFHAIADNKLTGGNVGQTYTLNIERAAADSNAKLQELKVSIDGTELSSFDNGVSFDPDTLTYTYTIEPTGNATASIDITATAQSDKAKVKIANGAEATQTAQRTEVFTFGTTTHTETYTIVVTPESGTANKKEYKVQIKREVAKGDFTDMEVCTDGASYNSIFADFDSTTKTQTIKYEVANVPVNSTFYVKPTTNSSDTKVTLPSGSNLSKNGDVYTGSLKFGLNTFKITATTGAGNTAYTIIVNLVEDVDDIQNIVLMNGATALDASLFTFSQYQNSYDVSVPSNVSSITVKVTPSGQYTVVYETGNKKLTKTGDDYVKTLSLNAGNTTTLVVYGVANNGNGKSDDPTAKGTEYTFNITRAKLDDTVTLDTLVVKINGTEMAFKDVVFDSGTTDYTIEIMKEDYTSASVSVDISATPTVASSTVTGTGTKSFVFQTNKEHESKFPITVKAESGATNTYNVTIKRVIIPGDFTTLEIANAGSTFEDVFTSANYDSTEKTYTIDLKLEEVGSSSSVRIKAVPTNGATVTAKGFTTTTKPSDNIWKGNLEHGKNEFTLTAASATGSQTYKFVINLYEDKNTIERISITADGQSLPSNVFSFSKSQTMYNFSVAYTVSTIKMAVTTDGSYASVVDEMGDSFTKATAGNGRNHERTISLVQGQTTTLRFRAKSDRDEDGEWYEFNITRESANNDASLKTLTVTVGGRPVAFTEGEFDPERLDYTIMVDAASSYLVNIQATPNVASTKVTGTGSKTFQLSDSTATQTYPVTTTAEDGTTRTYNVTISQKPVVLDSNYDITKIVINGLKDYYDDVPASYNDPVQITVPYNESKVKVVVNTATPKATVEITPALTKSGYLDLPEGQTVTLLIYAVAEDGTNASGADVYVFEITRTAKGEVTGPDTTITITDGRNEESFEFEIDSTEPIVKVMGDYGYATSYIDFNVDLLYGGTYKVLSVTDKDTKEVIPTTDTGKSKKLNLDYGTNVFCVNVESNDGHSDKSVVLVMERELPTLDGLSAVEIPQLRRDFDNDAIREYFAYTVASDVSTLTLDLDYDKDLLKCYVEGGETLEYGANTVVIEIYENTSSRALGDPLKTITLSVFREQPENIFWFIMFWVMLAIILIELVIVIILATRQKHDGNDSGDAPIIVTTAPAPQSAPPAQTIQPIIVQPTQTYIPPEDYLG